MEQIQCVDLSVGYDGKKIINGLNFTVNQGDYLVVLGENGSGKSTLMKTLLGLLPPLGGKIIIKNGADSDKIGYLPQQTAVQKDFPATVWEIVLSGFQGKCGIRFYYTKEEKNAALENIKKMGVSDLISRSFSELSGGQRQRVLLARALCAVNNLLLLDEPTTGLDPAATSEMYELVEKLNKDGVTVIMISHDFDAAVKYSSHILHIRKNIFFGKKEEYLESELSKSFDKKEEKL